MPADPAFTLAEHVCQTTFAALPASAVRARVVKHWGGREESGS